MAVGILGKKLGMSQVFRDDGRVIPVTVIEAGPCNVLQIKTKAKDGYDAVQIGFGEKKEKNVSKPDMGKFKKINVTPKRFVREIKTAPEQKFELGQQVKVDIFAAGDAVDVVGTSIGKGFQGGMKRWHWKGGKKTHGSTSHRRVGSIGSSTTPGRVIRGHHMPGRMGGDIVTIQNLEVVKIDAENNILVVEGAVPGPTNSLLVIKKAKKLAKAKVPQLLITQEKKEKSKKETGGKKEAKK
ncbi:MAG: 50S ribosomal protein L3 [Omnitrophica WOR_2 bacterium RIFCSPLOWO2_12_FULL_51_24]|nr:MAG: 50S ribosomal protein L3 [Omnitrophica WOR_2 bacterium RIFCSPLOWO2_12_FULL_51_24]